MNYAVIDDSSVDNVILLNETNAVDFPNAVRLGDRPVTIGDTYTDGKFFRDGMEVLTPLEAAQKELADMQAALAELGVTE